MDDSSRLARAAAWVGTASLALAATGLIFDGGLVDGAVAAVFAAIAATLILRRDWVPLGHTLVFVGVTQLAAAGMVFRLFDHVFFYDELVHCLTALAVTLTLGQALFRPMRLEFRRHPLLLLVATAAVGVSIGAAWEVYEFLVGTIGSAGDTASDLFWDAVGAGTAGTILALRAGLGRPAPQVRPVPARAVAGR